MFTAGVARARISGLVFGLLAAGAGAVVTGCDNTGSYRLQWEFAPTLASGDSSFASGDCGRVGVSGIQITATKSGSQAQRVVPCALGFYDGHLDQGTWTLALVATDTAGQVKDPTMAFLSGTTAMDAVEIHTGEQAAPIPPVMLSPLPQCQDGVDNDMDGRVDLDDPDCAGDSTGNTECGAMDGPSCNKNPPGVMPAP